MTHFMVGIDTNIRIAKLTVSYLTLSKLSLWFFSKRCFMINSFEVFFKHKPIWGVSFFKSKVKEIQWSNLHPGVYSNAVQDGSLSQLDDWLERPIVCLPRIVSEFVGEHTFKGRCANTQFSPGCTWQRCWVSVVFENIYWDQLLGF